MEGIPDKKTAKKIKAAVRIAYLMPSDPAAAAALNVQTVVCAAKKLEDDQEMWQAMAVVALAARNHPFPV